MGLFDNIYCKSKLPLPDDLRELSDLKVDWKSQPFQTRDLDNCLSVFHIEENGDLIEEVHDREFEKDDSHPFGGYLRSKDKWNEKRWHHGEINFYESFYAKNFDYWVEFKAIFTEGQLSNIELVEFTEKCNKKRREDNKKMEERIRLREERSKKLWYKLYRVIWKAPVRWTCRKIYSLSSWIGRNIYKLENKLLPF